MRSVPLFLKTEQQSGLNTAVFLSTKRDEHVMPLVKCFDSKSLLGVHRSYSVAVSWWQFSKDCNAARFLGKILTYGIDSTTREVVK